MKKATNEDFFVGPCLRFEEKGKDQERDFFFFFFPSRTYSVHMQFLSSHPHGLKEKGDSRVMSRYAELISIIPSCDDGGVDWQENNRRHL